MTQTTIGLPRFSNSLPLECNVYMTIKRSFHGLQYGLKGRGKDRNKYCQNVELKAKKTIEQSTLDQNMNEDFDHSKPK